MKQPTKTRGIFEKVPGSGIFWVRYTDGQGKYRRELAGSFSQASKLLIKRRGEALQRKKLPETLRHRLVTFSELADDALAWSRQHKLSHRSDGSRLAKLKEWFGSREADSLTGPEIEKRLDDVAAAEHWAASTYNHHRSLLMLAYREGRRAGKVAGNPARDVHHKKEDNSRVRFLTKDEIKVVRGHTPPEHRPKLDLALHLGLRHSNQFKLKWTDVDLRNRRVVIGRTKNGDPHYKRLNDSAVAAFAEQRRLAGDSEWVFPSPDSPSRPLGATGNRKWFGAALKKAAITGFHWHDWRHTGASHLAMNGASLLDIASFLGHKGVQMAMRYTHLSPEFQLKTVKLLETISTPVAPETNQESVISSTLVN